MSWDNYGHPMLLPTYQEPRINILAVPFLSNAKVQPARHEPFLVSEQIQNAACYLSSNALAIYVDIDNGLKDANSINMENDLVPTLGSKGVNRTESKGFQTRGVYRRIAETDGWICATFDPKIQQNFASVASHREHTAKVMGIYLR